VQRASSPNEICGHALEAKRLGRSGVQARKHDRKVLAFLYRRWPAVTYLRGTEKGEQDSGIAGHKGRYVVLSAETC
jgi:hypothetical protein